MKKHISKNSLVPQKASVSYTTYQINRNSAALQQRTLSSDTTTPLTEDDYETGFDFYYRSKPSAGGYYFISSQSIYVDGTNGTVKAKGEADDDARVEVGTRGQGGGNEGQVRPFSYEFSGLPEGYHTVSVYLYNVDGNPDTNLAYIKGSVSCKPIGIKPGEDEELEEEEEEEDCPCDECPDAGGSSSSTQSTIALTINSPSLSNPTSILSTSSAGTGSDCRINNEFMYWACNFATLRGMGQIPSGKLEIVGYSFDESLFTPAALNFKHPMAAYLVFEQGSTGFAPNHAFKLCTGGSYKNYMCDASGSSIFAIGSTVGKSQQLTFVTNISALGGNNIVNLSLANYMRVSYANNTHLFFSTQTGELSAYMTKEGRIIQAGSSEEAGYLATIRDEQTGIIRQIWNYWDGLADIVPAPAGQVGYSIHFYTPAQVGAFDETTELYPTTGDPFKSFIVTGDLTARSITVSEIDHGLPAVVEPKVATWKELNGAWTLTIGTGTAAITEEHTKEILPNTPEGWTSYRMVVTKSKMDAQGIKQIASCTAKIYVDYPGGKCVIEQIEGYGSPIAQSRQDVYDPYTGLIATRTEFNGALTEYLYDNSKRLITETRNCTETGRLTTQHFYISDGSEFDRELRETMQYSCNITGTDRVEKKTSYTYSKANYIKRVVATITATGSTQTQTSITETWTGDSPHPHTCGRVRMTQDINGIQTWHEYVASSLYGALYTHTQETKVNEAYVNGQSTRIIQYITAAGNTAREEQYVLDIEGAWQLISGQNNTYDTQNRRTSTSYDNGRSTSQQLMCSGDVLWSIDENGVRIDYAYDNARTLIEQTRAVTATMPETITEWVKDAAGRILQTKTFTGAMETTSSSVYDALGRIVSSTDILGRITTSSYSEDGLTSTSTTPTGATLITRRYSDGTIAEQSGTGQRHILYTYNNISENRVKSTTLPNDTILQQEHRNGFNQLVKTVEPTTSAEQNINTVYEYNNLGQLIREQRANLAATTYQYDSMGNTTREALVLNPYNPAADRKVLSNTYVEDATDGVYQVVETTRFNDNGEALLSKEKQLISQLSSTIESKTISIGERDEVTTTTVSYGTSLTQRTQTQTVPTSDTSITAQIDDGFTLSHTDQLGGTSSFTRQYTATGITSTMTDPRGNTSTSKTDLAGRVIEQTDAANNTTTTTYCNCCDNPASITDALGNVINYSYDVRGRKIAEYGTGIQPATYSYDDADRMTSFITYRVDSETITTDPTGRTDGDTTTISYNDATGLELSKTYANGTTKTRSYDSLNRLHVLTNARGLTSTYSYYATTSDITQITYSDGTPSESFAYNGQGYLTRVQDDNGICSLSYNHFNQFYYEEVFGFVGEESIVREEHFDNLGRNLSYTLYKSWEEQQFCSQSYDSKGRIATAGFRKNGIVSNFTYAYLNGTAMLTSITHPNGIVSARTYEAQRNLLTAITDTKNGSTLSNKSYTYDAIGRPTARNINARSDSFGYNGKSELTSATLGSDSYAYDYDNIGNRKTAQEIAEQITYETNRLNQYTEIQGSNDFVPTFDLDGNQTTIQTATGIWTVIYNAKNRPISFTSEDGTWVIECNYDYMGRRVRKHVIHNGNSHSYQQYLYKGYVQIAALDLSSGTLVHSILWDPTEPEATRPLSIQQDSTWYTYGLDLSKNITELYTATGTVANTYSYSPFGAVEVTGNVIQPLQWSSEVYDGELGLAYYNYRSYNPADGRWINRDPIGIKGGMNLYAYVENSVWLVDMNGLNPAVVAAYLGAVIYLTDQITGYNLEDCPKKYKPTNKEKEDECVLCVVRWGSISGTVQSTAAGVAMAACTAATAGWGIFACVATVAAAQGIAMYRLANSVKNTKESCKCKAEQNG